MRHRSWTTKRSRGERRSLPDGQKQLTSRDQNEGSPSRGFLHSWFQSMYSKTLTTLCAPLVVAAVCAADSASARVTSPIRNTVPFSVTTFTWLELTSLFCVSRPLMRLVSSASLLRDVSELLPATITSFCTLRTFCTSSATMVRSCLISSVGASPVSSTKRLKQVTLT